MNNLIGARWRARAAEKRIEAARSLGLEARHLLLEQAREYERLAEAADFNSQVV